MSDERAREIAVTGGARPSGPGSRPSDRDPAGLAATRFDPSRGVDWWRFLPGYWFQNNRTDRYWDAILNRALDEFGVTRVDSHTCYVGPMLIWTANWPYAFGRNYGMNRQELPMVRTRRRLRSMLYDVQARALASAIEARRAEMRSSSVHESAVSEAETPVAPCKEGNNG